MRGHLPACWRWQAENTLAVQLCSVTFPWVGVSIAQAMLIDLNSRTISMNGILV